MENWIFASRMISITLLGLIAIRLYLDATDVRFRRSYALLLLCSSAYLTSPFFFQWPGTGVHWPLPFSIQIMVDVLASATPAVFAVFTLIVFQDRLPHWALVCLGLLLACFDATAFSCGAGVCGHFKNFADNVFWVSVIDGLPHLLRLGFVVLAVYYTADGWKDDLVEFRRAFRALFLAVQGGLIVTVVVLENFLTPTLFSIDISLLITSCLIAICTIVLAVYLLRVAPQAVAQLVVEKDSITATSTDNLDGSIIANLRQKFEQEYLHRTEGLTIATLARELGVPEYRTRAVIHEQMGYRNFNEFLNAYRIDDAKDWLRDETKSSLPILTIALEVGYRSLSTFNAAFKTRVGETPSQFRARSKK